MTDASEAREQVARIRTQMSRALVGQARFVDRLLTGLLTDGHLLVEGLPGLAKTLAVRSLCRCLSLEFRRIQFTPDLLPADILGTQIYNPRTGEFTIRKGPIFASLVLADEINRAPAKVQAALLEAMAEKQVTIGDTTFALPMPFLVLATQNPIEQEGTYNLPEAQLDRFLMKVVIDPPGRDDELQILRRMARPSVEVAVEAVADAGSLVRMRAMVEAVHADAKIEEYIVDLVQATRHPATLCPSLVGMIRHGASPRATLSWIRAVRAYAFLRDRDYVVPGDVREVGYDILRHRLRPDYEAEARELTSDGLIALLFDGVPMP